MKIESSSKSFFEEELILKNESLENINKDLSKFREESEKEINILRERNAFLERRMDSFESHVMKGSPFVCSFCGELDERVRSTVGERFNKIKHKCDERINYYRKRYDKMQKELDMARINLNGERNSRRKRVIELNKKIKKFKEKLNECRSKNTH